MDEVPYDLAGGPDIGEAIKQSWSGWGMLGNCARCSRRYSEHAVDGQVCICRTSKASRTGKRLGRNKAPGPQGFGPACALPGVGHDIGQFEASFLNEFLRQHASDAYFEVEGLEWDEFEIEIDVGPPIPGITA